MWEDVHTENKLEKERGNECFEFLISNNGGSKQATGLETVIPALVFALVLRLPYSACFLFVFSISS